jgi:ribonuclease HII
LKRRARNGWAVIAGVDEAGRGPVIGPLVVAAVAAADVAVFARLGCTDSKLIPPDRRRALARALRREPGVRIDVRHIPAETLDAERIAGRSLNDIELVRFAEVTRGVQATRAIVDAADVDAARFGRSLAALLDGGVDVQSEHKADENHPVVGAASIIAKVERDAAVAQLARRLERQLALPLGSGYSSDPRTQAFLRAWWDRNHDFPEGTRRTWATARELSGPRTTRLDAFS